MEQLRSPGGAVKSARRVQKLIGSAHYSHLIRAGQQFAGTGTPDQNDLSLINDFQREDISLGEGGLSARL
jgi:hypothetical protein